MWTRVLFLLGLALLTPGGLRAAEDDDGPGATPAPAATAKISLDEAFAKLGQSDFWDRTAAETIAAAIMEAGDDRAKVAALETRLVAVLEAPATTLGGIHEVVRLLWIIGTERSVPALAKLLGDPKTAYESRYALERISGPVADETLRNATRTATGAVQVGLITTLGARRDAGAVELLKALLTAPEPLVATAAADSLGKIGTAPAVAALSAVTTKTTAVYEGLEQAGRALLAAGDKAAAAAVYEALATDLKAPIQVRGAALHGLALSGSAKAGELCLAAVRGDDLYLAKQAARQAAYLTGDVKPFRDAFDGLPGPVKLVLLEAFADRGDAAAGPLVVAALGDPDPAVAAVAVRAAGLLGGPAAVEPLAKAAQSADRFVKDAAQDALVRLKGPGVDEQILKSAVDGDPAIRSALMATIISRKMKGAGKVLLAAARSRDSKVAAAALDALGRVGDAEDLPQLIALLLEPELSARGAAEKAVLETARRLGREVAAPVLVKALEGAGADGSVALLTILAALGGEQALQAVVAATRSTNDEIKGAAVDVLANAWEDPVALPALLELARGGGEDVQGVALRGYLRLLALDTRSPAATILANVKAALALSDRPARRKQALAVLRNCRLPEAVELVAGWLEDEELAADAAATILDLASEQKRDGKTYPAVKGPAVDAALAKLRARSGAAGPAAWQSSALGSVTGGEVKVDGGQVTLKAAGSDIYGTADQGHFAHQPAGGDIVITARLARLQKVDDWTKAGVMIRAGGEAGAANVFLLVNCAGVVSLQTRADKGGQTTGQKSTGAAPLWLRLERRGDVFTGYVSADGQQWNKIGSSTVKMTRDALIGLAATSHKGSTPIEAVFDNVTVAAP